MSSERVDSVGVTAEGELWHRVKLLDHACSRLVQALQQDVVALAEAMAERRDLLERLAKRAEP